MAFAEEMLGIALLPWQRWLLIHALELKADGTFRFRTLLILVARQNGKTSVVEVKNLWKMYVLGVPLIIGTAQNLDIAEESWDKAVEIAESIGELAAEIEHVDRTNGKKALRLVSGSRWKIAAASRRGGRGLSGDDVGLDELREHRTWESWGAVTKTTMARRNAQVYGFSNAGDDESVVLNSLQAQGRKVAADPSIDPSFALFEWSAPDDVKCTCDQFDGAHNEDCKLQDRAAWAAANPALGYTITEQALASALNTDPEAVFRTECLCQKVDQLTPDWQVIPQAAWEATEDGPEQDEFGETLIDGYGNALYPGSVALDPIAFSVDVTPSREWATIAAAGRREDGLLHIEVVDHRPGTSWVVGRLTELIEKWEPCAVALDTGGPAGSLAAELDDAGIELAVPKSREVAAACGALYDLLVKPEEAEDWEPGLRHQPHPALTVAVAKATKRTLGQAWAWDRKDTSVVISPLVAVTLAAWAHGKHHNDDEGPPNLW